MSDLPAAQSVSTDAPRALRGGLPRFAAALLVSAAIGACAPTIDNHGSLPDKDQVALIKQGQTTQDEVRRRLGSPSATSAFDDKTWFYISSKKSTYAFFNPAVQDRQVLEVRFNTAGVVSSLKKYGLKDAKDVQVVQRKTPTRGREPTFVQSLMDLLVRGPVNRNNPTVSNPNTARPGQ